MLRDQFKSGVAAYLRIRQFMGPGISGHSYGSVDRSHPGRVFQTRL